MKALILERIHDLKKETKPLKLVELSIPEPNEDEVLIKVSTVEFATLN